MAKDTKPAATSNATDDSDEWERIPTGNIDGDEWDFDKGPLIGHFLGSTTVETDKVESGQATAYMFASPDDPNDVHFVWASQQLTAAFGSDLIRQGDKVRISFLGYDQFTGKDGKPRQVKRFRVDGAKRTAS